MTFDLASAIGSIESDKQAAREFFSKFVYDRPNDCRGHFYLAACLSNQLDYSQALVSFERADKLCANDSTIQFNLGYCHRQLGALTQAVFYLQKSVELSKWRDLRSIVVLASTLSQMGQKEKAPKTISRANDNVLSDPILAVYRFIIKGGRNGETSSLRNTLIQLCRNRNVVNYLVSLSMKYDFFRYSVLDDKYSLATLIVAARRQQNLDPWAYHPETYLLPDEADLLPKARKDGPLPY